MNTKKNIRTRKLNQIIMTAVISGIVAFISGLYVVESEVLIPPIATVIFGISAAVMLFNVVCYNRMTDN